MKKNIKLQEDMITSLKRIEGQIRGIKKMIENQRGCDEVINQIESSRSALKSLQIATLNEFIKNCIRNESIDSVYPIFSTVGKLTH